MFFFFYIIITVNTTVHVQVFTVTLQHYLHTTVYNIM